LYKKLTEVNNFVENCY